MHYLYINVHYPYIKSHFSFTDRIFSLVHFSYRFTNNFENIFRFGPRLVISSTKKYHDKGCQNRCELKRWIQMPVCLEPISFIQPIKPIYFNIFLTLQIYLSFLFLKVDCSSSKSTNNPPPVYIK